MCLYGYFVWLIYYWFVILWLELGVWYIDTCNFDIANILKSMGKDNPRVLVTRMGKGMEKNSYLHMDMGKLEQLQQFCIFYLAKHGVC